MEKMESEFNRIIPILLDSRILLKNIIHFAELLGASASEIIKLRREIDNNTVDYRKAVRQILEEWTAREGQRTVGDLITKLNRMEILDVAEKLEEIFPTCTILSTGSAFSTSRRSKLLKIWNVAEPVPSFVGREEEFVRLDAFFQNDRERVLIISGMGGQGKTQLCRKWIQLLKLKTDCPRIVWLGGESNQIFTSSILAFLKIEITHLDESVLKSFNEILGKIPMVVEEEKKVLWVIDNVDTDYEEIKQFSSFLLSKMQNAKSIITSRLRTILPKSAAYLTLDTLSIEAAAQLIRQSIDSSLEEENVKELCEETGLHALALQLSIGFIKSKQISFARGKSFGIAEFLSSFRKDKGPVLEDTEELSGYDKNLLHHVKMAMQYSNENQMQLPQAIMKILSLFRFDGVKFEFLLDIISKTVHCYGECRNDESGKPEVKKALDVLQSLSLISAELPIIQIHPLIQESTRILYPEWKVLACSILKHVDIVNLSKSNLQHILRLWEIVGREDSLLLEHVLVVETIYEGLYKTSQIQLLLPFTDSHRKKVLRLLGTSKEKEVIRAEFNYGRALRHTGKLNEALTHLGSLLTNAIKHLGKGDSITLEIELSKASTLYDLGRYAETEIVFRDLLPRSINVYGEEHNQTMLIKNNLALTLSECHKIKEALHLLEKILQLNIANNGSLHQETLSTRHNIACCYAKMGDFQKAKSELADILKLNREILGDKNFRTLETRSTVAEVHRKMGDCKKAGAEFEKLIEDLSEILGPTHSSTIICRHSYALCLIELGETDKAIRELKDVIEFASKIYGPNHPNVENTKILLQLAEESRIRGGKLIIL